MVARLFKKNENQTRSPERKGEKPRYDKGEQGLWVWLRHAMNWNYLERPEQLKEIINESAD